MHYISVWAMIQHVSSGSVYFMQLFPRKMQNRVSTLWGHPSFLSTLKVTKSDRGGGGVNGETETELIYSCCKTQRNLSNKGKEGKSRRTWNRTCEVCWVSQPIMHTFTTPREHGKCFTRFSCECEQQMVENSKRLQFTGKKGSWKKFVWPEDSERWVKSLFLSPRHPVGCCYGSIRCLRVLSVFWADLITPRLHQIRSSMEPPRWRFSFKTGLGR